MMTTYSVTINDKVENGLSYNDAIYRIVNTIKGNKKLVKKWFADYLDWVEWSIGIHYRQVMKNQYSAHQKDAVNEFIDYLFRSIDDISSPLYEDDAERVEVDGIGVIEKMR